ncbi:MAG: hypothetical protein WCV67_10940 [Victivallaceae bacterium]|jgi:hypothetical protein
MMATLSNTFGWDYFADWSGEDTLKNFPAVNIETAITLAYNERYAWFPTRDEVIASHKRNFTVYDQSGIAYWWLNLIPHLKINGRYVIYDGENPPSGRDSGYGWKAIAVKGDAIPDMITPGHDSHFGVSAGSGTIPAAVLWYYTFTVAEMEELIGETILPYPYGFPLFSAKYYIQFYKIINSVKHRLFYASPPRWFAGFEDYTRSDIGQSELIALLSQQNIYSVEVAPHYNRPGFYDAHIKTVPSSQVAEYPEDVYFRQATAYGEPLWTATDEFALYKHFEPGEIFRIDPPRIPAIPDGASFCQTLDLVSIEDRAPVADKFIFKSP